MLRSTLTGELQKGNKMNIYKKQRVVDSYPAYDIVERENDPKGDYINITSDDHLGLLHASGKFYNEYKPGSAVSYAIEHNEDPIKAAMNAINRGHELHWINKCATVITEHKQEKRTLIKVEHGTKVMFEGLLARIEVVRGGHLKFVEIFEEQQYDRSGAYEDECKNI